MENSEAVLTDCNSQDETQQWYIPDYKLQEEGYLVNVFDSSLCLNMNTNQIVPVLDTCIKSNKFGNIISNSLKYNNNCIEIENEETGKLKLIKCTESNNNNKWEFIFDENEIVSDIIFDNPPSVSTVVELNPSSRTSTL